MESSKLLLRKARLKKMAEVGGNKYWTLETYSLSQVTGSSGI
jgi:hypothetical protein